jgi:hypothetical protein
MRATSARRSIVVVLEQGVSMADRLEWESLQVSVTHELPQPVEQDHVRDGSLVLVGGHPGEVIVRLTRLRATVAEYAVEWDGPHDAVVRPITFGTVHWRRMPEVHAILALQTLIRAARDSRRSKYRQCRVCDLLTPPEALTADDECQECAPQ